MKTSINTLSGHSSFFSRFQVGRILVIALLMFTASQAIADGPRDRSSGNNPGRDAGRGDWRLGENNRIYQRIDGGWRRVQGSAIDVGDGWVIGTDRRSGGYGIYRWNGYRFDRAPGGAVEIGGTYAQPWVINNRGERFEWNGRDWYEVRSFGSNRGERRDDRNGNDRDSRDRNGNDRYDNDRYEERRWPGR